MLLLASSSLCCSDALDEEAEDMCKEVAPGDSQVLHCLLQSCIKPKAEFGVILFTFQNAIMPPH